MKASGSTAAPAATPETDALTWRPVAELPPIRELVLAWLPKRMPQNCQPRTADAFFDPAQGGWNLLGMDPGEQPPTITHWSPYPHGPAPVPYLETAEGHSA